MDTVLERRIMLEGSFNFRDLGGYQTIDGYALRWRRLFRSDALQRLTTSDLAILSEIGLRTVIDLRANHEIEDGGLGALHALETTLHRHVPFTEKVATDAELSALRDLGKVYIDMLDRAPGCIRDVFSILADDDHYPAVIHCAAGKDRTGMTIAILLRALGVPDEQILADYALTGGYLAAHIAQIQAAGAPGMFDQTRLEQIPPELLLSEPATLAAALNVLDQRFGSIAGYLEHAGVDAATVDQVRRQLLIAN